MKSINVKATVLAASLALTLTVPAVNPAFATTTDKNEAPEAINTVAPTAKPDPRGGKTNFGVNLTIRGLDGKHKNITGAEITVTNNKTGEVFSYTTDYENKNRNIHQRIPDGTYTLHLASVPKDGKDLLGKTYSLPKDKVVEVRGWSQYDGLALIETKRVEAPEPEASPVLSSPSEVEDREIEAKYTGFYTEKEAAVDKADTNSVSSNAKTQKKDLISSKALPQTSDVTPVALFAAVAGSLALIAAGIMARRIEA